MFPPYCPSLTHTPASKQLPWRFNPSSSKQNRQLSVGKWEVFPMRRSPHMNYCVFRAVNSRLMQEEMLMPRYLVERSFSEGLRIGADGEGAEKCRTVVQNNTEDNVTWIHSYVSSDRLKTFCLYDAPSPEAIRRTAGRNNLPVDGITKVSVLDPYFHH